MKLSPVSLFARAMYLALILSLAVGALPATAQSPDLDVDLEALREAAYAGRVMLRVAGPEPHVASTRPLSLDGLTTEGMQAAAVTSPVQQSGAWDRLVFQSARDGNWEIYSSGGDGLAPRRLTNNPAVDVRPKLTRDMSRVVFVSTRSGNYDIFSMKADGTDVRQLTLRGAPDDYPAWSADGRRIAFSYLVDDNAELGVMNADGSQQTRLTYSAGADLMPDWSPDGRQLVWAYIPAGMDRGDIVIANADGSNARTIATQMRFLERPVWSRDGSMIAFSADIDTDLWNELVVMNADGTGRCTVFDGGNLTDVTMGAWSANGSDITASLVAYVIQDNTLYIAGSALLRLPAQGGSAVLLSGSGIDMAPDWQPPDRAAPAASVASLPPQSAGPIPARWGGQDTGPAGIWTYDVQVREGPNETWKDWQVDTLATKGEYPATGGQTCQFRARARDRAGNVAAWPANPQASTTVETLPPVSQAGPLPPLFKVRGWVPFSGSDPGGSGILSYSGDYRELPAGDWIGFAYNVTDSGSRFHVQEGGKSYALRSTATDRAGNQEATHVGEGDAFITLYQWGAVGTVVDNRDRPIADASILTQPAPFLGGMSDRDGSYAAYVADMASQYEVSWAKPGYGDLPTMIYGCDQDARLDIALPPADNLVDGSDFEGSALGPGWTAQGDPAPRGLVAATHTGESGARVGQVPYEAAHHDVSQPGLIMSKGMIRDPFGAIHFAWTGPSDGVTYEETIYYRRRAPDRSWSAIATIAPGNDPLMAIANDGTVHLLWSKLGTNNLYYACRPPNGIWSAPIILAEGSYPDMRVDATGTLHIVFSTPEGTIYVRRNRAGSWSAGEFVMPHPTAHREATLAVDNAGSVHVFLESGLRYTRRAPAGYWTVPVTVSAHAYGDLQAASGAMVDGNGRVHLLAYGPRQATDSYRTVRDLLHISNDAHGRWTVSVLRSIEESYVSYITLAVDGGGRAHAVWLEDAELYYARRRSPDEEVAALKLADDAARPVSPTDGRPRVLADDQGRAHVLWTDIAGVVKYLHQAGDGTWLPVETISEVSMVAAAQARLVLGTGGQPHMAWVEPAQGTDWVLVYTNPTAQTTSDSLLAQTIAIPADMAGPTLSFWYRTGGGLSKTNPFQVRIRDGSSTETLLTQEGATDCWTHFWADLSPWAGRAVTLEFAIHQTDGQRVGYVDLDEVTVGTGIHPDLFVAAGAQILPLDEPGWLVLRFGNRGGVAVPDATFTLTLPEGILYPPPEPPATVADHQITMPLGEIPANVEGMLSIEVSVVPETPPGTLFELSYRISVADGELAPADNQGSLYVYAGGTQLWLPGMAQ